jgi:nicotinate-nucleotide adenylyltransferase
LKTIGIFGGTFDPIHQGHLQSALELKQCLALDELRLLPCHLPPHRQSPGCDSKQRLAMVRLAVADSALLVDAREIERDGVSYTVDTLEQFRQQYGDEVSLIWVMGTDAFASFDCWHRWQAFLSLAHIVVITRPGEQLPASGCLAELFTEHHAHCMDELRQTKAGKIWSQTLTPYPISATAIRQILAGGDKKKGDAKTALQTVLPAAVLNYIQAHRLYR